MKRSSIVLAHVGFWIFTVSLRLPTLLKIEEPSYYIGITTLSTLLHIIIFYLFYFYLGKNFSRYNLKWIAAFFIPFMLVYSIPATWVFVKMFKTLVEWGLILKDEEVVPLYVTYISVITSLSLYAIFGSLFRFSVNWFEAGKKQEELEKQNIKNELALLRSQINPHFLFNTLNNIHSYVYREPDKTANAIIKLSQIMRYMLYEANTDRVLLEHEIEQIKAYIELQKMRQKDPDFIDLKIDGDVTGKNVPPMLLITLIENAFKHGRKNIPAPGISVQITVTDSDVTINVHNYIQQKANNEESSKGFGLINLKRRLDLIYGSNYSLEISNNIDNFLVKMKIGLL